MINDKAMFLRLKVSRTLARELNQPGSYIFMRDNEYPQIFDVPMSIMHSDEMTGEIELLLQTRGIKTKLLKNLRESVNIRGPYWNGIMGLKNLKKVRGENCLIVVRGMAQAPSVLVAKKLRFSNNDVFILLDKGNSETNISKRYFEELGCIVTEYSFLDKKSFREDARQYIEGKISKENIKLVFSGGNDIIHKNIIDIIKASGGNILFSCTNNASICCGEGICGSCSKRLKDGRRIKACKAQVDPVDIIGGI